MMAQGYVVKVDEVGRVLIPIVLQKIFAINRGDYLEVYVDDSTGKRRVIVKKHYPGCIFCGELQDCVSFKDQRVCRKCIAEI